MQIIGLTGKKGSGKDTFASFLLRKSDCGTIIGFADPLKEGLAVILDESTSNFEDRILKEQAPEGFPEECTRRLMMQTLGVEWGRNTVCKDFWELLLKRQLEKYRKLDLNLVIIKDVRFDSEADFIRELGGIVFHVHRLNNPYDNGDKHESENGITAKLGDEVIAAGTLVELEDKAEYISRRLK